MIESVFDILLDQLLTHCDVHTSVFLFKIIILPRLIFTDWSCLRELIIQFRYIYTTFLQLFTTKLQHKDKHEPTNPSYWIDDLLKIYEAMIDIMVSL